MVVVVIGGVSQRKKERRRESEIQRERVHKDEKEFLQCFFNMFKCGPGCPGAFV